MALVPEEDWPSVLAFVETLGPHNPVSAMAHRVIIRDGQARWMELVDRCLFEDAGGIRELQCTGRDVTDRHHAEDQLRISNLIVEQSPMVVFRWRIAPGWPVTYVSENVRQWGYSAKELLVGQLPYTEIVHPDDLESVLRELDEDLASGVQQFVQQYRILTTAGEARWVEDHTTVECDATGRPVLMQGIVHDVHARKLIEQRLQMKSAALEATANAMLIADREGRIEWANTAYLQCCGCTLEHAQGRFPDELISAEIPGTTGCESAWAAVREGRTWEGTVVAQRGDGELRTKEMTITPVRAANGEVTRFIAVLQDITDRLMLEKQLHRSQRLESIGLLTGGVAHDFNNLLTVVLGSAEQLQEIVGDDPRLGLLARSITQGATRAAALTRQLLAFARQQPLSPQVLDVGNLATSMQSMLCRTLGEHINIVLQLEKGLWRIHADAVQLESALLNLAINARDAMPGGGQLLISARNAVLAKTDTPSDPDIKPGDYVVLTVADTGCGIPPQQLDRVLEPFFTTKEIGQGTGLGLAMVYGFARQSNGYLRIESEPGAGTRVRIYFPRMEMPVATAAEAPRQCAPPKGTETILVVEDDDMVRLYAEGQLTSLGYKVVCASNGPEAMDIVRQRADIDLVFTDMVMPGGMNGRDLAAAARAIRPGLKVLLTSGYTALGLPDDASADATAPMLAKPYRRLDLAHKVHDVLASQA
jgi:PAS domain S-box-containing protein